MYWKLFQQWLERLFSKSGSQSWMRSGGVTGLAIALVLLAALFAVFENHKGNYTRIKNHLASQKPEMNNAPRPGGQDPIVLTRARTPVGMGPEFLSATLLPGRGMSVLRISAYLPEKGEVELLSTASLPEAAAAMSGVNDDASGMASLLYGASFLSPWAGRLGGLAAIDGKSMSVTWRDRIFSLPANTVETTIPTAFGGLLLKLPAATVNGGPTTDGAAANATFSATDYDGRWISQTETQIAVTMSSNAMEFTVHVKNVGEQATPVGIGWTPRFLVPSGDRAHATLHVPATMREEFRDAKSELPTGKLTGVAGTDYDFSQRNGVELGTMSLNETFTGLKALLDGRPTVELRDYAAKYGLRISAISPTIKAVHVFAPADAGFVSISPQMNYDDPFGREWPRDVDTGMVQVQPGESVEWKIRLELFPLMPHSVASL